MFDKKIKLGYYIWSKDGDFMIFSSDFDRTLWLMLASDRKNRNDIVEFINNIPQDLYVRIHMELEKYNGNEEEGTLRKITKAFRTEDGETYFYTVSVNNKQIILNLSRWNEMVINYQDVTQISLYSLTLDQIKDLDAINPEYIGDYYHTCSKMSLFYNTVIAMGTDRGYELLDGDSLVIVQSVDGEFEKKIEIDRIPNEINIADLANKKSINRLIRNRRRK